MLSCFCVTIDTFYTFCTRSSVVSPTQITKKTQQESDSHFPALQMILVWFMQVLSISFCEIPTVWSIQRRWFTEVNRWVLLVVPTTFRTAKFKFTTSYFIYAYKTITRIIQFFRLLSSQHFKVQFGKLKFLKIHIFQSKLLSWPSSKWNILGNTWICFRFDTFSWLQDASVWN